MHISIQMTIHILLGFRHSHLCMNDYPHSYGFSSCTSLFEWLSIFFWVFVMHISVRMNIHIIKGFCHAHLCTNDYPYYFCNGFRHAHLCTNDYPYSYCMGFRHGHLCMNDYPYSSGFSSCTSLYEWLFKLFLYGFLSCTSLYEWLICSQYLSNAFL